MILVPFADEARPEFRADGAGVEGMPGMLGDRTVGDRTVGDRTVGEEVNDTVLDMLPWGISFLFHMALVLLALFIVWTATLVMPDQDSAATPMMNPTPTPTPLVNPVSHTQVQTVERAAAPRMNEERPQVDENPGRPLDPRTTPFGKDFAVPGAPALGDDGLTGRTVSKGLFDPPGGTTATRIVFLVDASGSLIADLPFVVRELKKSIKQLGEGQSFQVIVYRGNEVKGEMFVPILIRSTGGGLIPASDANKAAAIRFLDEPARYAPGGRAQPLEALTRAFALHPELIFLLSDNIDGSGIYEANQRALLDHVASLNTPLRGSEKRRVMIQTIQFIDKAAVYTDSGKGTLQLLAEQNGGVYKWVQPEEVGLGR